MRRAWPVQQQIAVDGRRSVDPEPPLPPPNADGRRLKMTTAGSCALPPRMGGGRRATVLAPEASHRGWEEVKDGGVDDGGSQGLWRGWEEVEDGSDDGGGQ